jgi:hypothetical protein
MPWKKLRKASREYSANFERDPTGEDPSGIAPVESKAAEICHYQ